MIRTSARARHALMLSLILSISCTRIHAQPSMFGPSSEIRYDEKTGRAVALYNVNSRPYSGSPEEIARSFLLENRALFQLKDDLDDLAVRRVKSSPAGYHVGLTQSYHGIPVFRSETVVSINSQNRVSMVVSGYRPDISVVTNPGIDQTQALNLAKQSIGASTSRELFPSKTGLAVYQDSTAQFHLAWKILVAPLEAGGSYLILVDAHSGKVLETLTQIANFVNGTGKVFDPDPGTALRDASLTDQNDSDYAELQPAYDTIVLNDLNDAVGGVYKVQGKYACSMDLLPPSGVVTETNPSNFTYNRSQNGFEEVNIYYFVDKQRRYVGSLGFTPTWKYLGAGSQTLAFDARGDQNPV